MPLVRRVPKRGFHNLFRKEYGVVNVARLAELELDEITPEILLEKGIVRRNMPVKILGEGEIGKALTVKAHKFSKAARSKIEAAGGTCEELGS